MARSLLTALVVLLASGAPAAAATFYVRTSGSDAGSGLSPASAWASVAHAADVVVAGDTVYVGAGTYLDGADVENSGTAAAPIVFVADVGGAFTGDAGAVVIDDGGDVFKIDGEDHIHVIGFRVTGGGKGFKVKDAIGVRIADCESDGNTAGIEIDGSQVEVSGCDVHDNAKEGVRIKKDDADVLMTDLRVADNGDEGFKVDDFLRLVVDRCEISGSGKEGVNLKKGGDAEFVNCVVGENTEEGFRLDEDVGTLAVWHSTVVGNGGDGVYVKKGVATVGNSILANNGGAGLRNEATLTHSFNLLFANAGGSYLGTSAGAGEFVTDPLFVGGGDYHLQPVSPAIDAGTDASAVTGVDRDANPRPNGAGFDLGAYEIPSEPLVLHWTFDEGIGQSAGDSSANALDGTLGGGPGVQASDPAWAPGILGCSALEFDGVDDYVELADHPLLDRPGAVTVTSWIRPDSLPSSGLMSILSKDENYEYHVQPGGEIYYWWQTSGGVTRSITTSGAAIGTGTWRHVAVSYRSGEQKVYVDGIERGSASHLGALMTNADPFHVGQDQGFAGRFFDGRIDDVRIYGSVLSQAEIQALMGDGVPCGPDHFAIVHDGSGVNCQAENVTIEAHDAGHALVTSYAGSLDLTTSTGHGDWSLVTGTNPVVNSGAGVGSYPFDPADLGVVVLGLRDTFVETLSVNATDGVAAELASEDPDLVFDRTGFQFLADGVGSAIGIQIAGKPSNLAPGAQALELQAIRTNDQTGACEAALQGLEPIELAFRCVDPASCAGPLLTVNGAPLAANPALGPLAYASVNLDFGSATDTTAPLAIAWPDAGRVTLHARKTLSPSGEAMLGASNAFAVRPFALHVGVPGNPAASDGSGPVFTAAGADFAVQVRAVLWQAGDDADADGIADGHADADATTGADLSDNATTPGFGAELSTEAVALAAALLAPSGGTAPGLGGATSLSAWVAGAAASTVFHDEVGVIEIAASPADGDWLGIGAAESAKIAGRSGFVGRFRPDHFDVAVDTAPVLATPCAPGGFGYLGQPFGYAVAPVLRVTARSALGTQTRNYTGAPAAGFFRLDNASLGAPTHLNDPGAPAALDLGGLPPPGTDPLVLDVGDGTATLTFDLGSGLAFAKGTPVAPFDAELAFEIAVVDADGVAFAANPFRVGDPSPGNGMAWSAGAEQRYGRLALVNAFGSELSPLPEPLRAEYWTGSGFAANGADACTAVPTTSVGTTARAPAALATAPGIGNAPLVSGDAGLAWSAPGAPGSADVVVNLGGTPLATPFGPLPGAGLSWLRFDWLGEGAGAPDQDPAARITFGIFGGNTPVIFRREIY